MPDVHSSPSARSTYSRQCILHTSGACVLPGSHSSDSFLQCASIVRLASQITCSVTQLCTDCKCAVDERSDFGSPQLLGPTRHSRYIFPHRFSAASELASVSQSRAWYVQYLQILLKALTKPMYACMYKLLSNRFSLYALNLLLICFKASAVLLLCSRHN